MILSQSIPEKKRNLKAFHDINSSHNVKIHMNVLQHNHQALEPSPQLTVKISWY
jgi:hypothetical protein